MLKRLTLPLFLFFSYLSGPAVSLDLCSADVKSKAPYSRGLFLGYTDAMAPVPPRPSDLTETRLGYYGYRHMWLHSNGVIKELRVKTGSSCCHSAFDGECRIAVVNMRSGYVEIDGMRCPFTEGIKIAAVSDVPTGLGVVCADRVDTSNDPALCPPIHCVGTNGALN